MHRPRAFLPLLVALFLAFTPASAFADTSFNDLLGQLEQMYQLPSGILAKVAYVENGGKATGCAPTSSACGMFQWTTESWLSATKALFGQPYDLSARNSPDVSAKVTAFALADAKSKLGGLIQRSGIDMTVGLYLSHFLGIGGAQTFLSAYVQNPGQNACALFPKGCAANGSVLQRSLSDVVNYFAQKLKAPGVLSVPGNFADSSGISYAYSYADINSTGFLPASTVITRDPTLDYPQTFTSAATAPPISSSAPLGTALQGSQLPQQQTNPAATPTTGSVSPTSTSSTSACAPRYYCSSGTVYYQSASCSTSTFQICSYGCLGTICAPSSAAASSSLNVQTLPSNSGSSAFGILGAVGSIGTSTGIAATSSLSPALNASVYTIGSASPWQSASGPSSASSSPSGGYIGDTLTTSISGQSYFATGSPLFRVLDQLRVALTGLLSYLGSL